jgi:hypothetical protein
MRLEALLAAGEAIVAGIAARHPPLGGLPIVGVGWATVELDRAEEQLRTAGCSGWEPATRDDHLGATARMCHGPGPRVVLLEPDTEGRLAASLARFGEGVAAVYVGRIELPVAAAAASPAELAKAQGPAALGNSADPAALAKAPDTAALGKMANGPLGPARLVLGRPAWGPHVLVLEPGVIA